MTRNRGDDGTRKLRAERLASYARHVDALVRDGTPASVPEIRVAVGYDEDHAASATRTPPPPPPWKAPAGKTLSLQSVPVLVAPAEDVAWFGLDGQAERLCAFIDGRSTVADILRAMGIGSEQLLALLDELQESGLVVVDLEPLRDQEPPAGAG